MEKKEITILRHSVNDTNEWIQQKNWFIHNVLTAYHISTLVFCYISSTSKYTLSEWVCTLVDAFHLQPLYDTFE